MDKFLVVKDNVKYIRRFNTRARTLEFNIKPTPKGEDPVAWIREAISDIVLKTTENLEPADLVGFTFCSRSFERGQGWLRFQQASKVSVADVWNVINGIFQSNSSGLNTDTFCLGVTTVRLPAGKGRSKKYNTFDEECSKRQGIIVINNKDNLCLPRALVVAKAFASKSPEYVKVRRDIRKLQSTKTRELLEQARVKIPEEGAGISELEQFQGFLSPHFKIVVYQYGSRGRDVIFEGSSGEKTLNLLYHNGHYNVITSCTAAFGISYYCHECHIPYEHKNEHRCIKTCSACQTVPPCEVEIKIKCSDCLRTFKSQNCYENHTKTVCQETRLCSNCLKTIKRDREHTCGEIFCMICQKHQPEGHLCYMRCDTRKTKTKGFLYIFYDLETTQETEHTDGLLHEPNLCVFKQCCEQCLSTPNREICSMCGVRLQKIRGNTPVSSYLIHLLQIRKKFKEVVVLAHNGQAFDHQFILNYILTETDLTPKLIMRGTKIILMQLENIKFLDSLNYFPMPLSALPTAFGLTELKKGYFPHLFNKKENENYVGILPPIEYYNPNSMKEESRTEFLKWYEEHKNDIFDFQKEIIEYCISDVEILTQACLKFREQMITTTNVCPFTEACTIASACNKVFRRNFLKPNTIGIIPKGGYRNRDNQSGIALKWLVWEDYRRNIRIQHAAKGQEALLHGVKVDGYCEPTKQIFEFHGCYWHGCPSCFKHQRDEPLADNPTETLNYRYESTIAKTERLRAHGYEVIERWECEFKRDVIENQELKLYVESHPVVSLEPLNPRDAFCGGRTGNCKTYYKASENEKIKYLDVCSLYPYVCKYGKYPVGHPQVFVGKECQSLNLKETEGLIKCKILPPQNLYHPVLPQKMNEKLMFVLCRTCGEHMSYEQCQHSEEERVLSGTWVIDEVLKAVEKGYKILDIYEIWQYKVEQYDPISKTGGLFTEMMNKFLKIKQEASGWPRECVTQVQKDKYIVDFFEKEGIQLDNAKISKNPGLRSLSKLMLNSFWGKLGQQENQPKTVIVNKPEQYFNLLINPCLNINSVLPVNEDNLVVNYELKEETYAPLTTVNVCIAAYTTAQARLKLYSYLEQLEERVLYYDTDSVIYSHKEGQFDPPTGDFIGDMTDELEAYGNDSYITEFACGGPKNYAFKCYSTNEKQEKVTCKVKGICLNYNAAQLVNFESIKDSVLNSESDPIKIVSDNIRRTKEHEVVTKKETKLYKPNSLKRKFLDDYDSVPYGFKRQKFL